MYVKRKIQKEQLVDHATEAAQAIAGALPVVPRRWSHSRVSILGVKALLVLMAVLIGMPSPAVWACACTEVVGGSGAVNSSLSVDNKTGIFTLVQSDIKLPGIVPVELTRTYQNSLSEHGPFGCGWSANMISYMQTTSGSWTGGDIKINFNGQVETFSASTGFANDKFTMSLSFSGPSEVTVFQKAGKVKWVFDFSQGTLKQYIDRNGNTANYTWKVSTKNSFDLSGNQISTTVRCPLTVTYPGGRQLVFTYGTTSADDTLCQQVTGPNGAVVYYTYTDGLLTGVSMGGDQVLHYSYQKIFYNGKMYVWLTNITYANAAEVNVGYACLSSDLTKASVAYVTGPLGYNHTYGYATSNNQTWETKTDSLNHTETYYSAPTSSDGKFANMLHTDALGNTTYTMVGNQNQILTVQNAKGQQMWNTYDINNPDYMAQRNLLAQTNSLGKTWNFTWNGNYNNTKAVDPLGNEVNYTYDGNGNLLTSRNGLNQTVVTNTYNTQGQVATVMDGRNNVTGFTYDSTGFLTTITDAAGKAWNRTYDAAGNMLTASDPLGNTASWSYNNFNKLIAATDTLGNVTSFTYDEMANPSSVTDANNNVTSYSWDQFQRKTSLTNALNNTIWYAYDAEANMTTLTDPLNHVSSYTYDAVNKKKTFKFPDGSKESYDYDVNGNMVAKTDCSGQQITYTYDNADRMITKSYGDGTVFTYSYDDANRATGVTQVKSGVLKSSISYTNNAANQAISVTSDNRTIGYGYDNSQNISQITYPSGTVVKHGYDARNRLNSITGAGGNQIVGYTRDDAGRLTKQTLPNGLETVYTYNAGNRLTQMILRQSANPSNVIKSFVYGYDSVGNKLWVQYKDGSGDVYKYDATYQIVGVKYGVNNPQAGYDAATNAVRTVTYVYDAAGNRNSVTDNGNSSTYTVNNLNQYTAVSGTNYTYSTRGDLIGDGTWTYQYNYEGHLINASRAGMSVAYKYDTQGRRIEKDINGISVAKYVYNGQNLIEELDGTGNTVSATYVYAGGVDHPVEVIKGGNTYYFQQDALGNVVSLTDSVGSVVEQYSYDVFGQPSIKDGNGNIKTTPMTPFLFTGREYDGETGLYHYRARAYSPALGRFTSRDPLGEEGGLNLYTYVENGVTNRIDPTGKIYIGAGMFDSGVQIFHWNDVGPQAYAQETQDQLSIVQGGVDTCIAIIELLAGAALISPDDIIDGIFTKVQEDIRDGKSIFKDHGNNGGGNQNDPNNPNDPNDPNNPNNSNNPNDPNSTGGDSGGTPPDCPCGTHLRTRTNGYANYSIGAIHQGGSQTGHSGMKYECIPDDD